MIKNTAKRKNAWKDYTRKRYLAHKRFIDRYKMLCGCRLCGYRKHSGSLDFHHRDGETKSFSIGGNATRSIKSIKAEMRKCVVLCKNCHYEIEHGATNGILP